MTKRGVRYAMWKFKCHPPGFPFCAAAFCLGSTVGDGSKDEELAAIDADDELGVDALLLSMLLLLSILALLLLAEAREAEVTAAAIVLAVHWPESYVAWFGSVSPPAAACPPVNVPSSPLPSLPLNGSITCRGQ